ncbi:MAG: HK97 gp10 family phage protein [Eubacteriales bacterium]|nr:HK97 gp10 family phage protein [Eubacteriales bacterium]
MAKVKFKVEGMKELQKSLKRLGQVPQKHVTSSARKGMNVVLKGAKSNAPEDTGDLKRGMKLSGERSRFKAKKVYRVIFDPAMNDIFQKPIKNPGSRGGSGKNTGYYPISQEYGFFAGDGHYIPGYRFVHDSLTSNAKQMEKIIIDTMKTKIDQEIRKAGLK